MLMTFHCSDVLLHDQLQNFVDGDVGSTSLSAKLCSLSPLRESKCPGSFGWLNERSEIRKPSFLCCNMFREDNRMPLGTSIGECKNISDAPFRAQACQDPADYVRVHPPSTVDAPSLCPGPFSPLRSHGVLQFCRVLCDVVNQW